MVYFFCNFSFWVLNTLTCTFFFYLSWSLGILHLCSPNMVCLCLLSSCSFICNCYCCYHKLQHWHWWIINCLIADNSYGIYVLTSVCIAWLCKWNLRPLDFLLAKIVTVVAFQCFTFFLILSNDRMKFAIITTSIWSFFKIVG